MEEKELIICSAIWFDDGIKHFYQPKNINTGYVICGFRHCSIYESLFHYCSKKNYYLSHTQGFLSNKNNFYNRVQAKEIAIKSGQVNEQDLTHNYLFSEDIY